MKKIIFTIFFFLFTCLTAEAQWIQQNSGTNQNLYDIEFINEKTGWAVGDAGVVIKTTNGGINWNYVPNPTPILSPNLWSVEPIDSNIVYVTSSGDFIMKTTDGGSNWKVLHSCPDCNSSTKGIYFMNKDTGWILGAYKVFRTYDGGETLDSFYAPWFTNYDIYFKDINTGVFCGDGRVFKSTNGGITWYNTNVPTIGVFYMFRKFAIVNNFVWISGSSNPPVYRSTNFCETWEVTDTIRNSGIIGLYFTNENTGFVGGGLNKLFKTTNGGFNWSQENTGSGLVAFISSIDFISDSIGWFVSGAGKIQHTTTGGQTLVRYTSNPENFPYEFELFQNYPNPFNSETTIRFRINKNDYYKLELFNITGETNRVLFHKKLYSGEYNFNLNADNLTTGIYFYKFSSENQISIKKFILLK